MILSRLRRSLLHATIDTHTTSQTQHLVLANAPQQLSLVLAPLEAFSGKKHALASDDRRCGRERERDRDWRDRDAFHVAQAEAGRFHWSLAADLSLECLAFGQNRIGSSRRGLLCGLDRAGELGCVFRGRSCRARALVRRDGGGVRSHTYALLLLILCVFQVVQRSSDSRMSARASNRRGRLEETLLVG